jgi:nucleotide-binding universal stress UspA family protein
MLSPKLILSPIDFSPLSLDALEVAQDLAKKYGSEILLLHVAPVVPDLPKEVSILNEGAYENDLIRNAKNRLQELAAKLQGVGIKARTEVGLANDVGMEIVRDAENADLIVISTHGMTGWRAIAFGSVAEKVVQNGTCPVLVLRAKGTGASSSDAAKAAAQANS